MPSPEQEKQLPKPDHRDDVEMVRKVCAGDPVAVDALLSRLRCVRRFIVAKNRQLGGRLRPDEIDDAVQETLFAVWRKLPEFRGWGSFEAWVYRFSYLELLSRFRKHHRRPQPVEEIEVVDEDAPEPSQALENEHLYVMLDKVGSPASDIIRLKHLEELSFDEIGVRMGTSPNTAKTRYYRGMQRLRELMQHSSAAAERRPS
jgi:RNA polymerase sigma-70 factor (ECF subfamily)